MAGHSFTTEAAAALVFGILYFSLWLYMLSCFITGRYMWKSRWLILFLHTTIRVASQGCGVAFGILAFDNVDVFVAYLILGAEGYFSLTLSSYYFLKSWHHHNFGYSWLGPLQYDRKERNRRILEALALIPLITPWQYTNELLAVVDSLLIPANAIIITGGSYLAGATDKSSGFTQEQIDERFHISKILRTTGQSIFFAITVAYVFALIATSRMISSRGWGFQWTIALFAFASFWLHVRGLFGVLQSAIYSLSYMNPDNYTGDGFTHRFTALEYCLAILPEFAAAATLNATYWTTLREPKRELAGKNVEGSSTELASGPVHKPDNSTV